MVMDKSAAHLQQQQQQDQQQHQQAQASPTGMSVAPSSDDAASGSPGGGGGSGPNASAVGREFVRQYYTLLNQAPLHLHRFYSANSSFVHGSLEEVGETNVEPVRGQQEIHHRIMQLNFRDCRAKIRQVDSHATLGDGVVVQVAGELSNDGKPLRRFMQTFVLAPQSHKKYYVHNDIFRYQDEVFGDSVSVDGIVSPPQQAVTVEPIRQQQPKSNGEGRHDSDKKDVVVPEASKQQQMAGPPPGMNIAPVASVSIQPVPSTEAAGGVLAQAAETLQKQQLQQQQEQQMDKKPSPPQPQQHQDKKVVEENGSAVEQQTRKPMPPQQQQPTQQQQFKPHQPLQKENSGASAAPTQPQAVPVSAPVASTQPKAAPAPAPAGPAAPMSYASLVKREPVQQAAPVHNTNMDKSNVDQRPPRGYSGSMSGPQSMKSPTGVANNNPAASNREEENNQVNSRHHQQGTGGQQPPTARGPPGAPGQHGGPPAARSSNPPMYVDAQQLFVGNLPHNCTEQDLEELFNQFGKVAEIRINNKGAAQSKTTPQGQRVPNFGFVVFEEERSVQDCLGKRPIHLYGNHRLNVEEKKNKIRSDNMGDDRMSSSGGPMGRGGYLGSSGGAPPGSGGRGHHHGYEHPRGGGGSQEYNNMGMGRGMMGENRGRGRGGSSIRGGDPTGRGGGPKGPQMQQSGQFKKKPPFGGGGSGNGSGNIAPQQPAAAAAANM